LDSAVPYAACDSLTIQRPHHHETHGTLVFDLHLGLGAPTDTAMSNALAEYLSALEARDAREKAQEHVIDHCKSTRESRSI
jgi:hypothetical protein